MEHAKEAMPVIRYRTRDLTKLLPPTSRSMRRMAKITGRSDDMMIIRGVNVFPTQIEELILRQPDLAPHYVCVITRPEHLDELAVRVEMSLRFVHAGSDAHTAVARQLTADIKNWIGVSANVELSLPGSVERSLGKAKRVVDKRVKV